MFIKYLRDTNSRHPYGCVVGIDQDHIGYSLCAPCDRFEKVRARKIAGGRASVENYLPIVARKLKQLTGEMSFPEAMIVAERRFPRLYAVANTLAEAHEYLRTAE